MIEEICNKSAPDLGLAIIMSIVLISLFIHLTIKAIKALIFVCKTKLFTTETLGNLLLIVVAIITTIIVIAIGSCLLVGASWIIGYLIKLIIC